MKLKVWVEVMTVQKWVEDVIEVDDAEWNAMTDDEREAYKADAYTIALNNVVGGGCEEIED